MGDLAEKNQRPTKRLSFWILLFLLLSVVNWGVMIFIFAEDHRAPAAFGQIALLVGLFAVLMFLPSDAQERERIIDTEAAAAALGISFWTGMMYGGIADGLDLPQQIPPGVGALFILVTYLIAKVVVELRHR